MSNNNPSALIIHEIHLVVSFLLQFFLFFSITQSHMTRVFVTCTSKVSYDIVYIFFCLSVWFIISISVIHPQWIKIPRILCISCLLSPFYYLRNIINQNKKLKHAKNIYDPHLKGIFYEYTMIFILLYKNKKNHTLSRYLNTQRQQPHQCSGTRTQTELLIPPTLVN